MNVLNKFITIFMLFLATFFSSLNAQDINGSTFSLENLNVINEHKIKDYHAKIALSCTSCHEGTDEIKYKAVDEKTCLSCHGSKQKVADRLAFLGGKNPHSSVHDGPNLSCYECHNSHKPSYNMCNDCHNTKNWMREIK